MLKTMEAALYLSLKLCQLVQKSCLVILLISTKCLSSVLPFPKGSALSSYHRTCYTINLINCLLLKIFFCTLVWDLKKKLALPCLLTPSSFWQLQTFSSFTPMTSLSTWVPKKTHISEQGWWQCLLLLRLS